MRKLSPISTRIISRRASAWRGSSIKRRCARRLRNLLRRRRLLCSINLSGAANPPYFVSICDQLADDCGQYKPEAVGWISCRCVESCARRQLRGCTAQPQDFPQTETYQGNIDVQRELWARHGSVGRLCRIWHREAARANDINAPKPGAGAAPAAPVVPNLRLRSTRYRASRIPAITRCRRSSNDASSPAFRCSRPTRGATRLTTRPTVKIQRTMGQSFRRIHSTPMRKKPRPGFDIKHRFVTSFVYDLPFGRADGWLGGSKIARAVFGGFQIGGIFVAQTGQPVNPDVAGNPANTTSPVRPNRLRDGRLPRGERSVDRWFDPAAFAVPSPFTYGNSGRNVLRAPGLVNLDFLIGAQLPPDRNDAAGIARRVLQSHQYRAFRQTECHHRLAAGRTHHRDGCAESAGADRTAACVLMLKRLALMVGVLMAPARRAAPGLRTSGPSADYRTLGQP